MHVGWLLDARALFLIVARAMIVQFVVDALSMLVLCLFDDCPRLRLCAFDALYERGCAIDAVSLMIVRRTLHACFMRVRCVREACSVLGLR